MRLCRKFGCILEVSRNDLTQLQFLYANEAANTKEAFILWYPFILIVRMFHMNDYLNNFNQENGFLIEIKFAQCSYDWYLQTHDACKLSDTIYSFYHNYIMQSICRNNALTLFIIFH